MHSSSTSTTSAGGAHQRQQHQHQQQAFGAADGPFAPGGPFGGAPGGAAAAEGDPMPMLFHFLLAGAPGALHALRTGGGGLGGADGGPGGPGSAGGLQGLFSSLFGGDFGGIPMDYEHLASHLQNVATPADPAVVSALPRSTFISPGAEADDACAVCQPPTAACSRPPRPPDFRC
ncbi:hypothetical protein MNEG_13110 [Monoraphidium neglectum]|uniref:Uncharacterized protein n=1 Tax=Monoraphidium neglectum TaxID=145388 RepID=A0A0D2MIL9_9CHLO|nr:hypothetical protein MNEG_13110 [Monoraphidium neglectum]KIY94850.1 hypothetical protein MNEG_13110 [Monoraphidium neglectum]|eukprot:XP_013893870.1 hypothetical protein MNEG_13110 [Monoraphidium neglectum]